jgi:MFS family permease
MVEVTLPVWVGMLTGSPGHVAGVAAAEILPSLLAGPFAGALADRLDARKAMIVCDLVRAVLVLSLLLAPVSLLVPCVYAVGFLVALVGLLFNPAKNVTPSSRSSGRDRQAARSPPRAPQSQRPWCWGPPWAPPYCSRSGRRPAWSSTRSR